MSELLLIIIIIALYTRLYKVKEEREQYRQTLLLNQRERHNQ